MADSLAACDNSSKEAAHAKLSESSTIRVFRVECRQMVRVGVAHYS